MSQPVVFLLGPSGVGKTTLGAALQQELGMLHVLFDGHPEGNGVDVAKLRSEWDTLLNTRNPRPLADEVRRRIEAGGHAGVAISCPSAIMPAEDGQGRRWHFPRSLLSTMASTGVRCAVLVGPLEACREAAIRRAGPVVTAESWDLNNPDWPGFQPSRFPDCVLEAFRDGQRRPVSELVREFRRRFMI
jgi:hypothetical protein